MRKSVAIRYPIRSRRSPSRAGARQPTPRLGTRGQPEESRAAILQAAVAEFAEHGIAGARTDAIARAAHVNKALLYYYFRDKDALYEAVLHHVFSGLRALGLTHTRPGVPPQRLRARPSLRPNSTWPCRQRECRPLLEPLVVRQRVFKQRVLMYIAQIKRADLELVAEWMRSGGGSARMQRVAKEYFRPIFRKLADLLREGIEAEEFRVVNPMDFLPSVVGVIIFYFGAAPLMKTLLKVDPLSLERIRERRAFVLDFISAALFVR